MSKIVSICGMAGSGKSEVSTYFENLGWKRFHLGATEETIRRFGHTNEQLEREVRLELREKYGMAAMIKIALESIKSEISLGRQIVIDNLYSWSEYKLLKEEFGEDFICICVIASPKIRYARLETREIRPLKLQDAISRDYAEIEEIEKGGPIAMADFSILNENISLDSLHHKIDEILETI